MLRRIDERCAADGPKPTDGEGAVAAPNPAHYRRHERAATAELVHDLSDAQWDAGMDGWPFEVSVRGALVHLLHDLEHHVWDVRRGYAKLALADGIEVVTSR